MIRIEGFISCGSVAVIKDMKPKYKYLMRITLSYPLCGGVG